MDFSTVVTVAGTFVAAVGGAGVLIIALAGWLGRVWANRIAQEDRARVDAEVERLRHMLKSEHDGKHDALVRRRDIYARLATGMRVFMDGPQGNEAEERFLEAYDQAYVWADEAVVQALADFLRTVQVDDLQAASPMPVRTAAYVACMAAMRRDSGFPTTTAEYRLVSFPQQQGLPGTQQGSTPPTVSLLTEAEKGA